MTAGTHSILLAIAVALTATTSCQPDDGLEVVGTLEWDRIELTADAAEPIVAIAAEEGHRVSAGQLVLSLDARRAQAQLDQARALLAQQEAHVAELKRGPRIELIVEAKAQLAGADGSLETARHELQRVQTMVRKKLLSPQDLDQARAAYDSALAKRDVARAELAQLEAGTTPEELDQAIAAKEAAAAATRALEVSLERLDVRAPVDGVLDELPLELGERPQAGAVVAVLLAGDAPHARVYLPEPLRAAIHIGSKAKVRIDGIGQPFDAHVRRVSSDPAFTPYYSLTEHDRARLSYVTEVELEGQEARQLPAGVPLQVVFDVQPAGQ